MREISREEHEMILNLFIMYFMQEFWEGEYMIDKGNYDWTIEYSDLFKTLKLCFPMDEVSTYVDFNRERHVFGSGATYIKEV